MPADTDDLSRTITPLIGMPFSDDLDIIFSSENIMTQQICLCGHKAMLFKVSKNMDYWICSKGTCYLLRAVDKNQNILADIYSIVSPTPVLKKKRFIEEYSD